MRFCFHLAACSAILIGLASAAARAGSVAGGGRAVPVSRIDPRSGQEVRTIVVPPRPTAAPRSVAPATPGTDTDVKLLVDEAAAKYDVNPALIDSVIQVESNYNPNAVSPKGAEGLMQLMPETARRFGVTNSFDPRENIHGGARYLKFLQETFKDDRLAIAAYNAGERAVAKYNNNVPPYAETKNYVEQVGKRYTKAKKAAEAKAKTSQIAAAARKQYEKPAEPKYAPVRQYLDAEGKIHLTTE